MYFFTDKTIGTNKEKLQEKAGERKLLFMKQIHSDIVEIVDKNWVPKECDAMITKDKDVALVVVVADCNPVVIEDSKKQVVAVVHAGRVGSYKSIVKKTILKMKEEFSCKDLHVSIGASIRECCYEVGSEVAKGYEEFCSVRDGKIYLDLIALNLKDLKELGIKDIKIDSTCSCCSKEHFSYRRDKTDKRFCAVAFI